MSRTVHHGGTQRSRDFWGKRAGLGGFVSRDKHGKDRTNSIERQETLQLIKKIERGTSGTISYTAERLSPPPHEAVEPEVRRISGLP